MNRMLYFIMFACVALFTSCSETDGEQDEFANWKERNEAYFTSVYTKAKQAEANGDNSWKVVRAYSKNENSINATDYIVVEVLDNGDGDTMPMYTDSVKIHYRGKLIPTATYEEGFQFDSSWTGNYNLKTMVPIKGVVNGFVDGFASAVLNMKEGDRWRIYIPYELGYGTSDRDNIPAYSTLIFDLTLADIWQRRI